ncbi:ABC transporter substrate-binding protein [Ilyobacter sp.]|uniref:ABC transporter substrate-binding protein n=1 Tax=Ilyobacter sp. TaxID=3100343 RepID=UPI00356989BE
MKSKTTLMTILLSFIIIFSISCSKHKEPIRIAINGWPPCELWYVAEDQGYFDDIPVEIVRFTAWSDSLAALYLGKVDVVHSTYFNTIYYNGKGEGASIILSSNIILGVEGLVVKKDLSDLKKLKGKKIAVETGTDEHFLLHKSLEKIGLSDNDIEIVSTSSENAMELFIKGEVDAAFTYEPFLSNAANAGKGRIALTTDENMNYNDCLLARDESLYKRKDDYAKLIKAWYKAQDFVSKNPEKAYRIMSSKENMTSKEFKEYYEKFTFLSFEENKKIFFSNRIEAELNELKTFMLEIDLIDDEVDVKTLYNPSIIKGIKGDL